MFKNGNRKWKGLQIFLLEFIFCRSRCCQINSTHHSDVELFDPRNFSVRQIIKSVEEITDGDDFGKMTCNFVDQVKPDGSCKGVSFLEVNGGNCQVGHPLFRLMRWLLHALQNLGAQNISKFLKNKIKSLIFLFWPKRD